MNRDARTHPEGLGADRAERARLGALAGLLGISAVIVGVASTLSTSVWPYSPDSAAYIEVARSLLEGRGFVHRPGWSVDCAQWIPLRLWPGGFPLTMTGLSFATGLAPEHTGLMLTAGAWLALPWLCYWALAPLLPSPLARLAVGALVALSPGAMAAGTILATDVPFLALTIASFGAWARGLAGSRGHWFVVAGILAGSAWLLRNAGVAVIVAYAGVLLLALALRAEWSKSGKATLAVVAAAGVVVLPWYVRNWVVFGDLQPYAMAPSTVSWVQNLRTLLQEVGAELLGHRVGRFLAWDWRVLLAATAAGAALIALAGRRLCSSPVHQRLLALWLALYTAAGMAMLVVARSTYEWGEPINPRHLLQYAWALLALGAWALRASRVRCAVVAVTALVTIGLLSRATSMASDFVALQGARHAVAIDQLGQITSRGGHDRSETKLLRALAGAELTTLRDFDGVAMESVVLSNDPSVARIALGWDARMWLSNDTLTSVATCHRPVYLAILASKAVPASLLAGVQGARAVATGRFVQVFQYRDRAASVTSRRNVAALAATRVIDE